MNAPPRPTPVDRELIALAVVVAVSFWTDENMVVWLDRARALEPRATLGLPRHGPVLEQLSRCAATRDGGPEHARARRELQVALHRFFSREIGSADA